MSTKAPAARRSGQGGAPGHLRAVLAIAVRELDSLFRLPVGWVAIALFCLLTGAWFGFRTIVPGQVATMRYFFGPAVWLLLPVAPAISMRLLSDEYRSGTIESLGATPVSDAAVVWGKYLGGVLFLVLLLLPTLAFPITLHFVTQPGPDLGPIAAGYLCLMLVGMLYLAVGTLASSLTSSQTLAFLATLIILVATMLFTVVLRGRIPPEYAPIARAVAVPDRVGDFAKGVIDTGHVVFFLASSVLFVTAASVATEARRWR